MSYKNLLLSILLICFFISCEDVKQKSPVYGSWSAKYIYVDGKELLGYADENLAYSLKPTLFTPDGRMIIFMEAENREKIEAKFVLLKSTPDSIELQSSLDVINGRYEIDLMQGQGLSVMRFRAPNREMYFEQITAQVYLE